MNDVRQAGRLTDRILVVAILGDAMNRHEEILVARCLRVSVRALVHHPSNAAGTPAQECQPRSQNRPRTTTTQNAMNRTLSRVDERLVEMQQRMICCTLREDLLLELSKLAREGRFDYLLVESTGISEPLPVGEARLGRRTVLTLPLLPPPQKN
jgi:hypothetical protein